MFAPANISTPNIHTSKISLREHFDPQKFTRRKLRENFDPTLEDIASIISDLEGCYI
jgi:hypothetical protein